MSGERGATVKLRKLGEGVYLAPGSPNTVIAVSGEEVLVVDPGIGEGRGDALAAAIKGLAGGDAGIHIALTHGHTDHLAEAPRLASGFESTRIHAPRFCVGLVEDTRLRRSLVYGGLVSGGLASMPMVSLRVDEPFEPGARLSLGSKAIGVPGHTPGSSVIVFEEAGVAAVGDAVLGERVLARFGIPFASDLRSWTESLGAILELVEAGYTIVPGHGPVARGGRARGLLEANRRASERVYAYVLRILRDHGPISLDRLAYMATRDLGEAEATPRQVLLNRTALSSVLAWLEEEGKVEAVVTDEGPAWRARGIL